VTPQDDALFSSYEKKIHLLEEELTRVQNINAELFAYAVKMATNGESEEVG
jgi:hypothetical protein